MVVSLQFNLVESLWQTFWRHQSSDNKSAHGDDDEGNKDTWFVFIYIFDYNSQESFSIEPHKIWNLFLGLHLPFSINFFFLARIQYELE